MSARSQHGFHPGAESLSAFAEQALAERERAEVFAHLAVCGRCRRVVALAREAADGGRGECSPRRRTERLHPMHGGNSGGLPGSRLRSWPPSPRHRFPLIFGWRIGTRRTSRSSHRTPPRVLRRLPLSPQRSKRRWSRLQPLLPRRHCVPQSSCIPAREANPPRKNRNS